MISTAAAQLARRQFYFRAPQESAVSESVLPLIYGQMCLQNHTHLHLEIEAMRASHQMKA